MTGHPGDKVLPDGSRDPHSSAAKQSNISEDRIDVRGRLGGASLTCLILGVGLWSMGQNQALYAAFIRVGILGATAWLAFPTLSRIRWRPKNVVESWALGVSATLVAVRPKVFLPLAVLVGLVLLFKIPGSRKPRDRSSQ